MRVLIKGAGVAGLTVALELMRRGIEVDVVERADKVATGASSFAGGMLAPWCERESADEAVLTLGRMAADWWEWALPGQVTRNGTLVVTPGRDVSELTRFAGRTRGCDWLDGAGIEALEPSLGGRFRKALLFRDEAHLDPRKALAGLHQVLVENGIHFHFGHDFDDTVKGFDRVIDCTGATAIGTTRGLRGVRGEMLFLETSEISLSRPVRLLHPRVPLYVVPRDDNRFMVGATMIESDDAGPMSARSLMELLNSAYALHPAFGEARVVETGVGVRPAYADNLPRVTVEGRRICVNGFHRHGFLLGPAMARQVAEILTNTIPNSERHCS
ncbi:MULTISPECIES: glycine oxidase ThiO [Alphaproteobacteria]|uniref:Glycine oxidase ThiO n=2 Tax=Alphaproteobacteria TaxID=28211 RepID=A0A512HN11_9HYPH|nr:MULTISPECIES: glycine oxidase ThiO [Alphaproteobacteria]GEO86837.1 glycine oxidase ThiO [Ciceribacter naphthalenivorans]GLR23981.1 glycine oxidase ThiO [Ciceribacter naphthalenivorans]GLT06837.1 glycine oxidase ThiO [Sphingomonas psychrolutea]